jgi:ATP-dependent DNA helicase DinG
MSPLAAQIEEIFSEQGILSKKIPGFSARPIQLEMAVAISQALAEKQVLIAEAGTGTGKTFAYLIPSLMSGQKVIVSTGTKNLQDQLFHRDVPALQKILGIPLKISLLKGRANYLCLHRLNTYLETEFVQSETRQQLFNIKQWSDNTHQGELDHYPNISSEPSLLPFVTSTAENCLGHECEFYSQCFLVKARRQAQESDILIINHHLFFADSQLKNIGVSDLLPEVDAVIFDEAHQLHEVGTHFLGETLSSRQIIYLGRDIKAEQQKDAPDMFNLKLAADQLIHLSKEMQNIFKSQIKGIYQHIKHKPQLKTNFEKLEEALSVLLQQLEIAHHRGKGLANCLKRTSEFILKFKRLTSLPSEEKMSWYEAQENYFAIHQTPVSISDYFQELMQAGHEKAWIFTSATLSLQKNFSHFEQQLGLSEAKWLYLESPFDYKTQALLYLPSIQSKPHEEAFIPEMINKAVPLLQLTEGRAFFLFTSHFALKEVATKLAKYLPYPLLVQGDAPKRELLKLFCELENPVLLGTSSFWEGVDVKGDRLSCVIIDRIPFASPEDPILKTRIEHYKRQGKNPFVEYQLPQAVIALRQGVGRLIRDAADRGVLMICDPRLIAKDYGETFLAALPPMPITYSLDEVRSFLQESFV